MSASTSKGGMIPACAVTTLQLTSLHSTGLSHEGSNKQPSNPKKRVARLFVLLYNEVV